MKLHTEHDLINMGYYNTKYNSVFNFKGDIYGCDDCILKRIQSLIDNKSKYRVVSFHPQRKWSRLAKDNNFEFITFQNGRTYPSFIFLEY